MKHGFLLLIPILQIFSAAQGISFGLIADPQYSNKTASGTRYYQSSLAKLRQAVDTLNRLNPPFLAVLGDFIDGYAPVDTGRSLIDLDTVSAEIRRFTGEKYAVAGNHDVASLTKEQFLSGVETQVRQKYYSFDKGQYHFVVLDGDYTSAGVDWSLGNFVWSDAWVPAAEKQWLINDLNTAGTKTVFILIHYVLVDLTSGESLKNAAEIRTIFENAGNVKAVFNGHAHAGGYQLINGIHYLTLRGMVEQALPNNCFSIATVTPAGDSLIVKGFVNQPSYRLKLKANATGIAYQPGQKSGGGAGGAVRRQDFTAGYRYDLLGRRIEKCLPPGHLLLWKTGR